MPQLPPSVYAYVDIYGSVLDICGSVLGSGQIFELSAICGFSTSVLYFKVKQQKFATPHKQLRQVGICESDAQETFVQTICPLRGVHPGSNLQPLDYRVCVLPKATLGSTVEGSFCVAYISVCDCLHSFF